MAIGTQVEDDEVMAEINMVPFIDVMLVLLIIFIITVPVLNHAIKVELPQASTQPLEEQPVQARLTINAQGAYFWNDQAVTDAQLDERLRAASREQPPPALNIRADQAVRYERVAHVLAQAQRLGLSKIGFVTDPQAGQSAQTATP
jgi:biopolymer transport protein ExbD